jgi:multisubunit Na+/H+ antiporter MnhF subunit
MSMGDALRTTALRVCGVETYGEPESITTALDWMEQSTLGVCVSQSWGGYYILLAFHSLGLAMLVGAMMVIDLRILGAARGISPASLPRLVTLGWWGFWINALSGIALFISEANSMFYNMTFRWKILLVFVGVASAYVLNRTIVRPAAPRDAAALDTASAKAQAVLSLTIWVAVIVVGRMIAYLD